MASIMHIRSVVFSAVLAVAAALVLLGVSATGAQAASAARINAEVDEALQRLYTEIPGTRELAERSAGVLVFPEIVKAGFLVGVQGGQGALRTGEATAGYYETVSVSYGLQAGVQAFGYALFFLSKDDLAYLDRSDGFELGTAPSLVVGDVGTAGSLTTTTAKQGILVFFFGQHGLMGGIGIQGTKITRIHPE